MAEAGPSVRLEALLAHREWVRGLARALVRDDAEAADLEQEVWLAAVRRPPRDDSSPRGWLATALRHALSNLRRGQRRRGARERAAARPEAGPSADAVVAEAEAHRRVVDAVMDLEEPYRTAVLLRFFEGLDLGAVAARTGVPAETARTRLKRARERLRARLGGDDRDGRRALGLCLLPLLRDALPSAAPAAGGAAALAPVAGGLAMTLKTKAAIAAAAAALLLLVGRFVLATGDPPPPPDAAAAVADGRPDPDPESTPAPAARGPESGVTPAPVPARRSPPPAVRHDLGVRIVDADEDAVPGARFVLGCLEDPFAPQPAPPAVERGEMESAEGRLRTWTFETDDRGRWSWRFPGKRRVLLVPIAEEPGLTLDGTWFDLPFADALLRVPRVPKTTAVVRALDLSKNAAARDFAVGFAPFRPRERVADGEVLRARLRLPGGWPVPLTLRQLRSRQYAEAEAGREDDGEAELVLLYRSDDRVTGRVLGADDRPVEGASVWLGAQEEARLGNPSLPFDARKLKGAVRTDYRGEFEVRGEGNLLSAWHGEWSPATIPISVPRPEIRLAARGSIRGVAVDEFGTPVAGETLVLDGGTGTRSGPDGSFAFERVEAGPRGLRVGKSRRVIVRVEPGRETAVEIGPGIPRVDVELRSGPDSWRGNLAVATVIPLGPVGSVHEVRDSGGMVAMSGVLPGRYLLLDGEGRHAEFEVGDRDRRVAADLGTSALLLRAGGGTPLFVLPGKLRQDPLVESTARRIQNLRGPEPAGLRVEPLPAGEVEVLAGEPGETVRKTRTLPPGGTAEARFAPR